MNVLLPQWVTIGAPGLSASSTSKTAGSSSRSRRTFATASMAASSVSATIGDDRLALEPDAVLGEDELLLGLDADERRGSCSGCGGRRPRSGPGRSPGTRSASDRSMPLIRAWWSGLLTIFRWSMPGKVRSDV